MKLKDILFEGIAERSKLIQALKDDNEAEAQKALQLLMQRATIIPAHEELDITLSQLGQLKQALRKNDLAQARNILGIAPQDNFAVHSLNKIKDFEVGTIVATVEEIEEPQQFKLGINEEGVVIGNYGDVIEVMFAGIFTDEVLFRKNQLKSLKILSKPPELKDFKINQQVEYVGPDYMNVLENSDVGKVINIIHPYNNVDYVIVRFSSHITLNFADEKSDPSYEYLFQFLRIK